MSRMKLMVRSILLWTKKDDLGAYEPGLTQEAFTARDKSDYADITQKLEKYGVCVIPNFIDPSKCDEILEEIDPHFYRYSSWQGSPFPKETTVVTRSVLHSPIILKDVVSNGLFCDMASHFLDEQNYFMTGNVIRKCSSGIQLNSGIVYKVGAGAANQGYHREDHIHHTIHQACERFQYGKETLFGVGVAFTDMNKLNGATRVIVGSTYGVHTILAATSIRGWNFMWRLQRAMLFYFWAASTMQPARIKL
ncbi:YJR154W-like protein [Saccharomyces cerevisiae x Saccharomyces kudriavzevii VIN7]|uniref:YJR154W-like protein n=1 Tax=Saccharomyces cerevisiae x Saccharomyces kudriavzevii (strain VIN7) TaxID=1095631 RepID=H0H2W9_SACCK|nr:YJR154W-like protein [Saccharomyces cerevisiae x Saccharomyces kudriavzevii VIN7]